MTTNAPQDPQVNSGGDQFPVTAEQPRLSWRLPPGRAGQDGYELDLRIDGAEHRIEDASAAHLFVAWPLPPLTSGQSVAWRVRSRLDREVSEWSRWHQFEAGLFEPDWTARWISPQDLGTDAAGARPAYSLAGRAELRDDIVRAGLYSTALGVYEVFVNGARAGTAELAPRTTS